MSVTHTRTHIYTHIHAHTHTHTSKGFRGDERTSWEWRDIVWEDRPLWKIKAPMPQCIESLPTGTAHTDREHSRTKTNAPSGSTAAETHLKTTAASRKHTGTPSSRSLSFLLMHARPCTRTCVCTGTRTYTRRQMEEGDPWTTHKVSVFSFLGCQSSPRISHLFLVLSQSESRTWPICQWDECRWIGSNQSAAAVASAD